MLKKMLPKNESTRTEIFSFFLLFFVAVPYMRGSNFVRPRFWSARKALWVDDVK